MMYGTHYDKNAPPVVLGGASQLGLVPEALLSSTAQLPLREVSGVSLASDEGAEGGTGGLDGVDGGGSSSDDGGAALSPWSSSSLEAPAAAPMATPRTRARNLAAAQSSFDALVQRQRAEQEMTWTEAPGPTDDGEAEHVAKEKESEGAGFAAEQQGRTDGGAAAGGGGGSSSSSSGLLGHGHGGNGAPVGWAPRAAFEARFEAALARGRRRTALRALDAMRDAGHVRGVAFRLPRDD